MPEVNSLVLQVKSDSVEKGADRLDHLTRSATKAERSQLGLATSSTATNATMGKTATTTGAAATSTTGYATATKGATAATTAFGTALKAAIGPVVALLAPLLALKKAVGITADLEHSLSGVKAVTGATAKEMQELEAVARDLGATTVFSATQAAKGMAFLGRAGFEVNEIISTMPGLLDLAAAGQLDLAEASDIASNVLSGFGLEVDQTARVVDVLALSAASANTDIQRMGQALSFTAPIASALGVSIEETATAIGIMSDAGIGGTRAGTGLRRIFAALLKVTPDAEKALAGLGLTMEDISPQTNGLGEVLVTLADAGLDVTSAFKIFGDEGASAILALTGRAREFEGLTEALEDSEGAAGEMAITLSDDLQGSYKKLGSAASEFAIRLDETIGASNLWRDAIDAITDSVGGLSDALGTATGAGESDINRLVRTYDSFTTVLAEDTPTGFLRTFREETNEALAGFSEVEIALARAENQLTDLTKSAAVATSTALKRRPFENPILFAIREQEQAQEDLAKHERATTSEQKAAAAERIEAKREEVQILKELLAVQQEMDVVAAATATKTTTAAPDDAATKEFERVIRQLQTEEEAIETSFQNRLEIIRANTEEASALRLDLETRAAEERNESLLKIEKKRVDEENALQRQQFQNFQQVTMLTATLTGQLADMVEEGSSAQKALFIAQKGISIAQAIINTELGATAALGLGPFGIPMSALIRTLGYASVGVMVGQTVGSFATGGVVPGSSFSGDSVTANVNSGEMILNGSQQARLFNIADNKAQSTGAGGVNITVENYGSSEITVEQISENDIRIIARDQARQVVREDAPSVIASDLQSANSRTSRSLSQNTKTERRR